MTANAANTETARQFNALAPERLTHAGRTYRRKGGVYDNSTNTVRFDYCASRKRRGAFLADKLTVSVTLNAWDLYDLTLTRFDGLTLDSETLCEGEGASWETFRDLQAWVA